MLLWRGRGGRFLKVEGLEEELGLGGEGMDGLGFFVGKKLCGVKIIGNENPLMKEIGYIMRTWKIHEYLFHPVIISYS